MKCNNLLCPNYQSDMHDNCRILGQAAKDCKKSCAGCLHFVAYEGCVLILECRNFNKWEGKPE